LWDTNEAMLKDAKKSQAIAQNDVKKREARVKKAEKAYEDKVSLFSHRLG
jgi:ribosome recycling factor